MTHTEYRVSDIMTLVRRPVNIEPSTTYHEIGLRSFGNGVFHKEPISGQVLGTKKVFYIAPGDLLLSSVFAWEGAVAIASEKEAGKIGSHRFMTYMVDTDRADPRYLMYYFYGGPGLRAIHNASPGSTGRNRTLGISSFQRQILYLPTAEEQRRVADKLDALLSHAAMIEDRRSRMTTLQRDLRESLISSALETGTCQARMGDILALTRTEVEIAPDRSYRAIGMRSFGKGIIHYESIPGSDLSKLKYYSFPIGALTFNNIMAWEGAISVTTEEERDFIASQRFLFYTPMQNVANVSYLRHYFLSRPGLALISSCSPGAMARNRTLGIKKFEELKIPLPSRTVQDKIASTIDTLQLNLAKSRNTPTLSALRPSILNAAFDGRL